MNSQIISRISRDSSGNKVKEFNADISSSFATARYIVGNNVLNK